MKGLFGYFFRIIFLKYYTFYAHVPEDRWFYHVILSVSLSGKLISNYRYLHIHCVLLVYWALVLIGSTRAYKWPINAYTFHKKKGFYLVVMKSFSENNVYHTFE